MADLAGNIVTQVSAGQKQIVLAAGDRVVTVINPTTLTGGTIVSDSTVPAGKKFVGVAGAVNGLMSDAAAK